MGVKNKGFSKFINKKRSVMKVLITLIEVNFKIMQPVKFETLRNLLV